MPMIRQQVASTAAGWRPMTSTPEDTGVPMIGPSPSMPTMPSTMAKAGRTVALMSRIEGPMPAKWRTFFGQP